MKPNTAVGEGDGTGRRVAGLCGAALAVGVVAIVADGLATPAYRMAMILAAVMVLWVTEALPLTVTGLLGVATAVVAGVAPATEAFAPFADPLMFVFVGTFLTARALFHHGVDRRIAFALLAHPAIGERPVRVLGAFAAATCLVSGWISNTATVAMMLPVALAVVRTLAANGVAHPGFGSSLLLAASFGASIGGLLTPVGTPPNLIGVGLVREATGYAVPFVGWMVLGAPIVLVLVVVAIGSLARDASDARLHGVAAYVAEARNALGPWTRGQCHAVAAFVVTVVLWLLPGVAALVLGADHDVARTLATRLPEGVSALLGASLVFLLPGREGTREATLPWTEAAQIEWPIIFLYGAGMALGALAFRTGLAAVVGEGIATASGVQSTFGLVCVATALGTLLSETTSNTASANMVVPVVIAIARAAGIDPVLPALGATMGASLGFMLPVSTPCNAMVYGTGHIPLRAMLRHGLILDVAGVVAVSAVVGILGPLVLTGR